VLLSDQIIIYFEPDGRSITPSPSQRPTNMTMKVKNEVSLFLCLHNGINKDLLIPNIMPLPFNVLRDNDDVNLGNIPSVAPHKI